MDGSQKSFKCLLFHTKVDKSKRLPSVPILIGNQVLEKYETIKSVLVIINYLSYRWMVLADLKMINYFIVMVMMATAVMKKAAEIMLPTPHPAPTLTEPTYEHYRKPKR